MRSSFLFLFLTLALAVGVSAQAITPVAQISLQGEGRAIFIHGYSGIPIVQTNASYAAVDPVSHRKLWEMKRSSSAAAVESVGGDAATDYAELYDTPYVFLNGSILDATTGKIIVDGENDGLKSMSAYYIVPEADLIVVEMQAKGKVRLYGIDPFKKALKWGVDLREISGLAQAAASVETASAPYVIPPLLTASGDLLYHNAKYLAAVDLKTGSLRWNQKLDPGYIFLNDDATRLLVAEQKGGLGGMMTLSTASGAPSKFGKTLYLLDAKTGESLWTKGDSKMGGDIQFIMPYDGGFAVVHDEGFNIYDYTPGKEAEGRWKKDYAEKGISNIIPEAEGMMLYFKNRRMLIDPKTGEDIWKKAEKLERDAPAYTMGRRSNSVTFGNANIYTQGGTIYVAIGKKTAAYRYGTYTIDKANNRLVIARIDNPEATYMGAIEYSIIAVDLNTGTPVYGSFGIRKGVDAVDAVADNGYFFYNDRGFTLMKFANGSWTEVKNEYYPDPSRGERALKGAVVGLALGAAQVKNEFAGTKAVVANDPAAYSAYESRMNTLDATDDATKGLYTRRVVGRVEQDFGYFFSRNDADKLVLFKVEKKTGMDVKQYPFEDTKPVYEIDSANNLLFYLVDDQFKIFNL